MASQVVLGTDSPYNHELWMPQEKIEWCKKIFTDIGLKKLIIDNFLNLLALDDKKK